MKKQKGEGKGFGSFKSVVDWLCMGKPETFETLRLVAIVEAEMIALHFDIVRDNRRHRALQKKFEKQYNASFK